MQQASSEPSAWVKRYYREAGMDLTNDLLDRLLRLRPSRIQCSRGGICMGINEIERWRTPR